MSSVVHTTKQQWEFLVVLPYRNGQPQISVHFIEYVTLAMYLGKMGFPFQILQAFISEY